MKKYEAVNKTSLARKIKKYEAVNKKLQQGK